MIANSAALKLFKAASVMRRVWLGLGITTSYNAYPRPTAAGYRNLERETRTYKSRASTRWA
jgi:hypothetical protein